MLLNHLGYVSNSNTFNEKGVDDIILEKTNK